jgi:hypothetical protein
MGEIDQDVRRAAGETIAVETAAVGDGQLCLDARLQPNAIVTGLGEFIGETLTITLVGIADRPRLKHRRLARRHHQDVEHVADPGARQMGVAEAHDRAVVAMIARAGVPAAIIGVRPQLHHAIGQRRSREGVAVPAGTYEQVWLGDDRRRCPGYAGHGIAERCKTGAGEQLAAAGGDHCSCLPDCQMRPARIAGLRWASSTIN